MYRKITGLGNYAVELLTSGRTMEDEWAEMEDFVNEGNQVIFMSEDDMNDEECEVVIRDYLNRYK